MTVMRVLLAGFPAAPYRIHLALPQRLVRHVNTTCKGAWHDFDHETERVGHCRNHGRHRGSHGDAVIYGMREGSGTR